MAASSAFADFCCELLAGIGSLRSRRMFGGWGLSLDGLTVAIVADLVRCYQCYLFIKRENNHDLSITGGNQHVR